MLTPHELCPLVSDLDIFQIKDNKASADLWLLNSCTVKNPAEDHFRNEVNKGRDEGKHVVVAGCVPQGQPRSDYIQVGIFCSYATPIFIITSIIYL